MGLHPIKLSDDEAQALINKAFHATGYRLDRRDPVIVQYMVQKILLMDFDEKQRQTFSEFTERIIPVLRDEAKKMEEQRNRLGEWARLAAREVVQDAGEEYSQRIRETIRTTDNTMLENLKTHVAHLQTEQKGILSKLKEQHQEFADTAEHFRKALTRLVFGGVAFFSIIAFVMLYFYGK